MWWTAIAGKSAAEAARPPARRRDAVRVNADEPGRRLKQLAVQTTHHRA